MIYSPTLFNTVPTKRIL